MTSHTVIYFIMHYLKQNSDLQPTLSDNKNPLAKLATINKICSKTLLHNNILEIFVQGGTKNHTTTWVGFQISPHYFRKAYDSRKNPLFTCVHVFQ